MAPKRSASPKIEEFEQSERDQNRRAAEPPQSHQEEEPPDITRHQYQFFNSYGHADVYAPHENNTSCEVETFDLPMAYTIDNQSVGIPTQNPPSLEENISGEYSNISNADDNNRTWSTSHQCYNSSRSSGSPLWNCSTTFSSDEIIADLQDSLAPMPVQYAPEYQENDAPYPIQDIIAGTTEFVRYRGDMWAGFEVLKAAQKGYRRLDTPDTTKMSLLFALEISFRSVFADRPDVIPSLATIFALFFGTDYRHLAQQMFREGRCSRDTVEELGDLNVFQARMMVDMLSRYVREPVMLLVVRPNTTDSESDDCKYTAQTMEPLRTWQGRGASNLRVVLLYVDQPAHPDPSRGSRWYGIGHPDQEAEHRGMSRASDEAETPTKGSKFRHMITDAPTLDTHLPFEFMAGITAEDLLIHFPNHVFYWPEVAARVVSDGYTWKNIAETIKKYHTNLVLKPNTVGYTMRPTCEEFFGEEEWNIQRYQNKPSEELPPSKLFATKPWNLSAGYGPVTMQPSWTLGRIARASATDNVVPGSGPFQKILQEALNHRPLADSYHSRAGRTCNPPLLPPNWKPSTRRDRPRERKKPKLDETRTAWSSKFLTIPKSQAERDAILAKTRDPLEIIETHTAKLYGELLLWLLSKDGGRKETGELTKLVRNALRGRGAKISEEDPDENIEKSIFENGIKMPARSTFSKRKETALKVRAKALGISHDEAFRQYEYEMWHGKEESQPHKQRKDKKPRNRTLAAAQTGSLAESAADRVNRFIQQANNDGDDGSIYSPSSGGMGISDSSSEGTEEGDDDGNDADDEDEEVGDWDE